MTALSQKFLQEHLKYIPRIYISLLWKKKKIRQNIPILKNITRRLAHKKIKVESSVPTFAKMKIAIE